MSARNRLKTVFSSVLPLLLALSMTGVMAFTIHADNTLRKKPLKITKTARVAMRGVSDDICCDTLYKPSRDSIQVSGYDKPLRTSRETMLVTNNTGRQLKGLGLTLTYNDMRGSQLHQRTDTLTVDIPAGETRLLHFSTWDAQHSYYYHRGQIPRTANVTPYDVVCNIDFILLMR